MTRILITGSTGFLGGAVVAQLLEQGRIDEVLLLVRASITAEAMSRIAQRLQSFKVSEQKIALLKPVHFLLSDISHLESFIGDVQLREAISVINCAVVTSFGNNPKIWPINVNASMAFADAARRWPKLHRFLHVGTAMACGAQSPSLNMLFDNRPLLAEGIPQSPCFADYIPACVLTSLKDSIVDQMRVDFK